MTSLSALIDATQTDPSDWTYISEGGATIVFSYSGPSRPLFECTVLRLRKIKKSAAATGSSAAEVLSTGPDDPSVEFQARVTSKLIPSEYLPRLENAYVHEPWLTKLAELQDSKRPEARRSVDGINVKSYRCVLATDLIGRDGWAVEIKVSLPRPARLRSSRSFLCLAQMGVYAKPTSPLPNNYTSQTHPLSILPTYALQKRTRTRRTCRTDEILSSRFIPQQRKRY